MKLIEKREAAKDKDSDESPDFIIAPVAKAQAVGSPTPGEKQSLKRSLTSLSMENIFKQAA